MYPGASWSCRALTIMNRRLPIICFVVLSLCLGVLLSVEAEARKKSRHTPRPQPELKILDLSVDPNPFEPSQGPLQFNVTIQLPKELNGGTILEVTSLISSPSKTSLRFLTHRQSVEVKPDENGSTERPSLSVALSWDGQDHRKQSAGSGTYSYEVRTKLLVDDGEKGPRTIMVAWPKRGTLEVK